VDVHSVAISLVIFPLTLVDISVSVPEFAFAVGFVFAPFSLVFSTVRPDLSARSVSETLEKVSFVDSSVLKHELFNELKAFLASLHL